MIGLLCFVYRPWPHRIQVEEPVEAENAALRHQLSSCGASEGRAQLTTTIAGFFVSALSLVPVDPSGSHESSARQPSCVGIQGRLSPLLALEVSHIGRAAQLRPIWRADPGG